MASEALYKATRKYNKKMTTQRNLKFNKKTDADILEHIEGKAFQTYVKELIRKDIEESKKVWLKKKKKS